MREETSEPEAVRYHYNREERAASLPEGLRDRPKKGGILRGNRSLLITLLDVFFLVMLVVVVSVVTRVIGGRNVLPGYNISASAFAFEDRVLVGIKVKARENSEDAEAVRIRIAYPEGGGRIELHDFLPARSGVEEIYRGSLIHDSGQTRVRIDLFTDGHAGSMSTRIKEE